MVEHTAKQVPRGGWRAGFYVKPKHIGLVSCVSLVGCMVVFGAGFIVGMGYKASEQISPYAVKKPPTVGSSGQEQVSSAAWEEESLTFYDALTQPAKMIPVTGTIRAPEPASIPMSPAPAVMARETSLDPQESDPANAFSLVTDESVVATYSVQVASFLAPERAERLIEELTRKGYRAYVHPFEAPGQPLWYRVKVGKFADRATANLTLEKLGTPDAMLTRD